MSETNQAAESRPIPRLQQLFENIWLLLTIGVVLPTIVYTAWSVYDLVELPYFGETPAAVHSHSFEGTRPAAEAPAPATEGVKVSMRNLKYQPARLVIPAGTTVTWVNDDPFPHAVAYGTLDTPDQELLFRSSGDFTSGESFSYTFDTPGEHPVYCSTPGHFAAGMTMTVVVEEDR